MWPVSQSKSYRVTKTKIHGKVAPDSIMLTKKCGGPALLLPLLALFPRPVEAQAPSRQVIILIIDRVSWAEVMQAEMPALKQRVLPRAAVGLMNGGVKGRESFYGIWPTLGAGRPAVAGPDVFMTSPLRADEYNAWHPAARRIARLNERAGTHAIPGLLGTSLRRAGIATVLVTVSQRSLHHAAMLLTDEKGRIDAALMREDRWPGDIEPMLRSRLGECAGAFVVVDADYVRQADEIAQPARLFELSAEKAAALRRFDDELARQLDRLAGRENATLLVIMSASGPGYISIKHRAMCPVIVIGPGVRQGLLTSASTRTPGLVASADLAPTVLAFFRIQRPETMSGHVMERVDDDASLRRLTDMDRNVSLRYWFRYLLVKAYVAWQAFVFALMAWLVFLRRRAVERWGSLARRLNLVTLSLPLAFLFLPAFQVEHALQAGVLTWAVAALLAWVASQMEGLMSLGLVSLWTVAVLCLDASTGGLMMRQSILGHNPLTGLRFYGVGNEYMAILLAAACVGLGFWRQAARQTQRMLGWPLAAAAWVALVLLLGAPGHGANFGGSLAAAFVLPFAVWPTCSRARAWQFAAAVVSTMAFAVIVVWLDVCRHPEAQSHIGQTARLLGGAGPGAAAALLRERLSTAASLYRQIPLNLFGLTVCLAAVGVTVLATGGLREVRGRFPAAWAGLEAAAVAALAVTVFNDSGVVAGGAAMTFVLGGLLGLLLNAVQSGLYDPHPGD